MLLSLYVGYWVRTDSSPAIQWVRATEYNFFLFKNLCRGSGVAGAGWGALRRTKPIAPFGNVTQRELCTEGCLLTMISLMRGRARSGPDMLRRNGGTAVP
jgi:hypothetical protein